MNVPMKCITEGCDGDATQTKGIPGRERRPYCDECIATWEHGYQAGYQVGYHEGYDNAEMNYEDD